MNRITKTIRRLSYAKEKAFIPFITAGYPDLRSTAGLFTALEDAGADIIEIGMPFSDPLADGPTIQMSSHEAIAAGATPEKVLECIRHIRASSGTPVILFTYANLILHFGIPRFMEMLTHAGGDGLLVPDLPVEESHSFRKAAHRNNIRMVFLISPLTSTERMKMIERHSDDFVYCVSITGVTGAREPLFRQIQPYLARVRDTLSKPFVVGFGVSGSEDARNIAQLSDGVVVGSALIRIIQENRNDPRMIGRVREFAAEIHKGLD